MVEQVRSSRATIYDEQRVVIVCYILIIRTDAAQQIITATVTTGKQDLVGIHHFLFSDRECPTHASGQRDERQTKSSRPHVCNKGDKVEETGHAEFPPLVIGLSQCAGCGEDGGLGSRAATIRQRTDAYPVSYPVHECASGVQSAC
jgi:hypothetical protein